MKEFAPINFLLLFSGCGIVGDNVVANAFDIIWTSVSFISQGFLLYFSIRDFKVDRGSIVFDGVYTIEAVISIVVIATLHMKRRKIQVLLLTVEKVLSPERRSCLGWQAFFLTLISIMYTIQLSPVEHLYARFFVLEGIDVVRTKLEDQSLVEEIVSLYTKNIPWFMSGYSVYVFLIKSIRRLEDQVLTSIRNQLSFRKTNLCPFKTAEYIENITKLKETITEVVSISPCTWFAWALIRAISTTVRGGLTRKRDVPGYINWRQPLFGTVIIAKDRLDGIFILVLLIYLMYLTEGVCQQSNQMMASIVQVATARVRRGRDWTYWAPLIEQVEQSADFSFTAFGFFDINRKLLLSFTSTFVTFTVLFAKLLNTIPEGVIGVGSTNGTSNETSILGN